MLIIDMTQQSSTLNELSKTLRCKKRTSLLKYSRYLLQERKRNTNICIMQPAEILFFFAFWGIKWPVMIILLIINTLITRVPVGAASNTACKVVRDSQCSMETQPAWPLWWNIPEKEVARRNPGVVKKPALTFQRPDSQHQLTLLTLACACSSHTPTLSCAKESSLATWISDNPSGAIYVLRGQQTGSSLSVCWSRTVGAISDNPPLPFVIQWHPAQPTAIQGSARKHCRRLFIAVTNPFHWRAL